MSLHFSVEGSSGLDGGAPRFCVGGSRFGAWSRLVEKRKRVGGGGLGLVEDLSVDEDHLDLCTELEGVAVEDAEVCVLAFLDAPDAVVDS